MKLTLSFVQEIDRRGRRFDSEIELRAANADGSISFKGHAALFSKRYSVYGMFIETFALGAFDKWMAPNCAARASAEGRPVGQTG